MVINATNDIEPPAATVPQGRARLIDAGLEVVA